MNNRIYRLQSLVGHALDDVDAALVEPKEQAWVYFRAIRILLVEVSEGLDDLARPEPRNRMNTNKEKENESQGIQSL